jgi:hypothetical protein
VSQLAQDLEQAKLAQVATRDELEQLELQRVQMEASVRKAAQVLFLRERIERQQERLAEKVGEDKELSRLIATLQDDQKQLGLLTSDIQRDPNVELLSDALSRFSRQTGPYGLVFETFRQAAESLLGSSR